MRFLLLVPDPEQSKRLSQTIIECCRLAGSADGQNEAIEQLADGDLNLIFLPADGAGASRGVDRQPARRLVLGGLVMDLDRQLVFLEKQPLYLTRKEYILLRFLFEHQDAVVSRSQIMDHVWDPEFDCFSNTLESHILSLRKKICRPPGRKLIHTVFGRGYLFGELSPPGCAGRYKRER